MVAKSKVLAILFSVFFTYACEKKSFHVPRPLARAMQINGCIAEADFYETEMMRPPLYVTGFLTKLSSDISATAVRCVKEDGLHFLFDIRDADSSAFGCKKLVKYPFPQAGGGMVAIAGEFQTSSFKPLEDAPSLEGESVKATLFGLSEYATGDLLGTALTCVDSHWYKIELD
jgi:hypothetical protein